jgi:hypothetical protein
VQDPPFGSGFALEANVLEEPGIPKGIEITFNGGLIVDVSGLGEDVRTHDIGGHRAIAVDLNFRNHVGLLRKRHRSHDRNQSEP